MSWEYRVMNRNGDLAIYEVYYGENGRVAGYSENPTNPRGETLEELRLDCELYVKALEKPILEYVED
ncbi:hypothetical protein [Tahibacter amnicola]|uniref:Uncharacterized protein n=1 Tax=Tahibacter amnicola TaxID=2976241 RepID=A0ABY6BAG8_9GAMM|nr:hypothetical protein [Tahibacter amnicola]UXI66148.1 hypothetical protein N4264_15475 [Tahibacter amnicola]